MALSNVHRRDGLKLLFTCMRFFGIIIISNPIVCDVCVFKPTVFSENKFVFKLLFTRLKSYKI